MPDYADLAQRYTAAVTRDLEPLIDEAAQAIGADDVARGQLGGFLAQAWMAGATAASHDEAVAEAARVAQTVKQGLAEGPNPE